jgi:hypothetical protein
MFCDYYSTACHYTILLHSGIMFWYPYSSACRFDWSFPFPLLNIFENVASSRLSGHLQVNSWFVDPLRKLLLQQVGTVLPCTFFLKTCWSFLANPCSLAAPTAIQKYTVRPPRCFRKEWSLQRLPPPLTHVTISYLHIHILLQKNEAIAVTGRGSHYDCEMLRIPNCLGNLLTVGGQAVSLMHRPLSTLQKHHFFLLVLSSFCYRLSKPQDLVWLQDLVWREGLGKSKQIHSPYRVSNPRSSGL